MNGGYLQNLIERTTARHQHLCPRQVLGLRIALAGVSALGLDVPRRDKRLLVILETDGCFADGIELVTGARVSHRTMRVEDLGKIAATFVDVKENHAFRIAPQAGIRSLALEYAPEEKRKYFAQLNAYQIMPEDVLLKIQQVYLTRPVCDLISRAGMRLICYRCGEEIINEREIYVDGQVLCKTCAGQPYYTLVPNDLFLLRVPEAQLSPVSPGQSSSAGITR